MEQLIIVAILLLLGYSMGTIAEKRHYKSIKEREKIYLHVPVVTMKNALDANREVHSATLVTGNVVVSIDYFKKFLATLRFLVGGNVKSYETLIDRGRREAILRMKQEAGNVDIILNLRIETSSIGKSTNKKNSIGSIEVYAYGTAIRYKTENEIHS